MPGEQLANEPVARGRKTYYDRSSVGRVHRATDELPSTKAVDNGGQVRGSDRDGRTQLTHREPVRRPMENAQNVELRDGQVQRRKFLDMRPVNLALRPVQEKHQLKRDGLELRELDSTATDLLVDVQFGSLSGFHRFQPTRFYSA